MTRGVRTFPEGWGVGNTVQLVGGTHKAPTWSVSGGTPLLLWDLPKLIWSTDHPSGDLLVPVLKEIRVYTETTAAVLELELLARQTEAVPFSQLSAKGVMFKLLTGKDRRAFPCDIPLLSRKVWLRCTNGLAAGTDIGVTILGRLEWRIMPYDEWNAWFMHYQLDLESWWDRKYLQEGFRVDGMFQRDESNASGKSFHHEASFGTFSTGAFQP